MPSIDALPPPAAEPVEAQEDAAPASSGPIIGIIYPPPEVRNIVDKTASFVARNGPEFEARIRQNELGNPKFNFLNSGDPYHAYYQHKVKDIREGKAPEVTGGPTQTSGGLTSATGAMGRLAVTPAAAARQQEILKSVAPSEAPPPRDPPPEFEFLADPPSISAIDLDIVKLTAQFVARNGRQFLTDLMNREQRNYQFDFLRPQHSLFQYFTRLLEQYTKVLLPPKELVSKLGAEVRAGALEQAKTRAAWHAHQARQRAQDEARVERERVAYAAIDWHDFVVVETVDYPAGEPGDFPPPTTPLEVGARVLAQERGEDITVPAGDDDDTEMQLESDSDSSSEEEDGLATMEDRTNEKAPPQRPDDNRVQDMEEDSSEDEEPQKEDAEETPTPLPPRPDRVVVKKYDPKRKPAATAQPTDEWLVSPITGEKIPAHKVAEHVRIGLLDPRWLEQRDRAAAERTDRDEALAPGASIEASLKQLAERRTDIFGVGDEETAIGKKIGEEEKKRDDRVTWDGHTSSVEAATRAARAHITLEDQIHQIHKVKGLLPDEEKEKIGPKPAANRGPAPPPPRSAPVPMSRPVLPPPAPPPAPVLLQPMPPLMVMPLAPRPPLMATPVAPPFSFPAAVAQIAPQIIEDDEPSAKRARTEDSLEPERSWLGRHGAAPVALQVALPLLPERGEWRLDGRLLPFSVSLGMSVAELKNQVHRHTNMPQAKQKLHYEGMFLKDSNSLAFYNVPPGAVIQLQVKERGGRKK